MPHYTWVIVGLIVIAAVMFAACSRRRAAQSEQLDKAKPAASHEEIDATIADWVDSKVREGFETRKEIVQGVTEIIDDEYEVSDAADRVAREVERRLKEHLRSQSSWPQVTDCDRIDRAFAALEAKGIVARQNFTCCQTCGNAEIGEEIEEFAKTIEPKGYTYYHMQDTEGACEDGSLYLAYGTVGGTDEDAVAVGNTIRDTLVENGLTVEWDGQLDKRICITGLDWKKRRNPE